MKRYIEDPGTLPNVIAITDRERLTTLQRQIAFWRVRWSVARAERTHVLADVSGPELYAHRIGVEHVLPKDADIPSRCSVRN